MNWRTNIYLLPCNGFIASYGNIRMNKKSPYHFEKLIKKNLEGHTRKWNELWKEEGIDICKWGILERLMEKVLKNIWNGPHRTNRILMSTGKNTQ